MSDDLRHNMNLVIPGLNFWGDQNDAAKSVVDKTKWVMETAINRIEKLEEQAHYANGVADLAMKHRDYAEQRVEKLEAALRQIIQEDALTGKTVFVGDFGKIARKALEGKDDPQADL
jgi:hypothetical protein